MAHCSFTLKEWISLKQSSLCVRPAYTNTVSIHKPSILILTEINYNKQIQWAFKKGQLKLQTRLLLYYLKGK